MNLITLQTTTGGRGNNRFGITHGTELSVQETDIGFSFRVVGPICFKCRRCRKTLLCDGGSHKEEHKKNTSHTNLNDVKNQ